MSCDTSCDTGRLGGRSLKLSFFCFLVSLSLSAQRVLVTQVINKFIVSGSHSLAFVMIFRQLVSIVMASVLFSTVNLVKLPKFMRQKYDAPILIFFVSTALIES